jgi:SAM-dependent methyltransferase
MPNEHPDLETLSDLCTPWCVRVVVTLRVAEHIAEGITDVKELAAASNCDAQVLHAVLGYLVARGVFEETTPGRFGLNAIAHGLLDPSRRIGLDLEGVGGRMAYAWGTLLTCVRTGGPGYSEVFGRPFWEDLDAHPEIGASFDALIGQVGHGTPNADIDITGGWESVRTVVDVGGGTGGMLAEILRLHPAVRGTLVDLPRPVALAGETFRAAGVQDRAITVGQSFFDPLPAGRDVYVVRGVLNDWPDADALRILRRCAEAARPAGRVLILKGVRPEEGPPMMTIETVLLGGRTRTRGEMEALVREAGLRVIAAGSQAGTFVLECGLPT